MARKQKTVLRWVIYVLVVLVSVMALFFTIKHLTRLGELERKSAGRSPETYLCSPVYNFGAICKK